MLLGFAMPIGGAVMRCPICGKPLPSGSCDECGCEGED